MSANKPVSDPTNDKDQNSPPIEKDTISKAHEQAEKDIENDPDLSIEPKPGDDLDEGELARLEGEE